MSAFLLSPGITPELTDIFVIEVPIALLLGYLWNPARGVPLALALNALALGAIKVFTDWADFYDLLVAVGALLAGAGAGLLGARPSAIRRPLSYVWVAVGAFGLVVGAFKMLYDFYDPFDLLLAVSALASGLLLILHRRVRHLAGPLAALR